VPSPVEVLSGVPFDQAERAVALLRHAGIPVNVRRVVEGRWLYVAAADEKQALELLAAHRFPDPMFLAGKRVVVKQATGAAPGDDVWALLTQEEPPWPDVYSFP
jgi:type III secretory pathway lipoprotein EscJ